MFAYAVNSVFDATKHYVTVFMRADVDQVGPGLDQGRRGAGLRWYGLWAANAVWGGHRRIMKAIRIWGRALLTHGGKDIIESIMYPCLCSSWLPVPPLMGVGLCVGREYVELWVQQERPVMAYSVVGPWRLRASTMAGAFVSAAAFCYTLSQAVVSHVGHAALGAHTSTVPGSIPACPVCMLVRLPSGHTGAHLNTR